MPVDGKWNIVVNSPMGTQKSTVTLTSDGSDLTGTTTNPQGKEDPIGAGKVDGDNVSWELKITTPMPMTLVFEGVIAGDSISGNVKAGAFGSFAFSGERA